MSLALVQVGVQCSQQSCLASHHRDQLDLGSGQIDRGRSTPEPGHVRARLHHLGQWPRVHQDVVDAGHLGVMGDAKSSRGVALRVQVKHQHQQTALSQGRRHVHGGGGLAHSALLVGDRDYPGARRGGQPLPVQGAATASVDGDLVRQRRVLIGVDHLTQSVVHRCIHPVIHR